MDRLTCDLCGGDDFETIVETATGRAMRSDRVIVARDLAKAACRACGLVSAAGNRTRDDYARDYRTSVDEHVFYSGGAGTSRSRAIADWMVQRAGDGVWRGSDDVVEIGAGAGLLMAELQARFPGRRFAGVEPNDGARAAGLAAGRALAQAAEALGERRFGLAYSVAVIEHVSSPTAYLAGIRRQLRAGGHAILVQPTADVASYDLFFVDHLHHFGSAHLAAYAAKTGFVECSAAVGHGLMPNFSLHVWRAVDREQPHTVWDGPPAATQCAAAAVQVRDSMAALDAKLDRWRAAGTRVAAFGLQEVFALARAYSALDRFPIACGLDDDPGKREYSTLGFPVTVPEHARDFGISDVILTMNALYYPMAQSRCERLGLTVHPLFQ